MRGAVGAELDACQAPDDKPRRGLLAIAAAMCAVAALMPVEPARAQGWGWVPWGEQRPPVPREPVRPQPPPMQAPPPVGMPPPQAPPSASYGQPAGSRSAICVQLEQRLVVEGNSNQAQALLPRLENDIRQLERTVRGGQDQLERSCYEYEFLMFGKSLKRDPACRNLASQVDGNKRRLAELDAQRQQILQSGGRSLRDDIVRELARNNCGARYQQEAAARSSGPFSSLWQDEGVGGGNQYSFSGSTFRTVCVRLCDGAFFPVSFSTLPNHFERDQEVCQSKCAAPAELYYHSQNPGQGIEHAISHKTRQPYTTLRTAFRFKKEFVQGCSCKTAEFSPAGPPLTTTAADRRAEAQPSSGGQPSPMSPAPRR